MKANCNDWLTFRDERYTLVYESLRRVTTTTESTRIITYLNVLSSFEYLIMFSSSSYHIKTEQSTHQVHWLFSRQNGRYTTPVAAVCVCMALQEVFQQQIIINQLIRGRLRWGRWARVRHILKRPRLHPDRRCQFGIHDQLNVELRKEDSRTFQNPIERSVVVSINNIRGTC